MKMEDCYFYRGVDDRPEGLLANGKYQAGNSLPPVTRTTDARGQGVRASQSTAVHG